MCLSKQEIRRMSQIDIREAELNQLTDISEIMVDMNKPVSARVEEYIEKTGNPFLVRVGEYVVKIGYSNDEDTLSDRMKQYIRKIAEIKY